MLQVVVAPLVGVAAYMVVHIAMNWITRGRRLLCGFVLGVLVGWAVQLAVSFWGVLAAAVSRWDAAGLLLVNQFTYLAIADLYSHFVNIQIASLRVRVLHELASAPDGLTSQQLLQRYNAADIVRSRLTRLTGTNHLRRDGDRYYTRFSTMLLLAQFYQLLKWIVLGKSSQSAQAQTEKETVREVV